MTPDGRRVEAPLHEGGDVTSQRAVRRDRDADKLIAHLHL